MSRSDTSSGALGHSQSGNVSFGATSGNAQDSPGRRNRAGDDGRIAMSTLAAPIDGGESDHVVGRKSSSGLIIAMVVVKCVGALGLREQGPRAPAPNKARW